MINRAALSTVGVILAMAFIILVPALVNGFVFTDIDSWSYMLTGIILQIPEDRPVYYSLFAAATGWGISPWPIAVAQCLLLATLIWHVARVLFGVTDFRALLAIAALLTVASALPWYADYIMPDVFTAVLMIAAIVIGFRWDRLGPIERGAYFVLVGACVSFHYGNVMIALGANLVFAVIALLGWRWEGRILPRIIAFNGATLLAVAALVTATTVDHGRVAMSSSSSTFYLARLLDDGSALKVLKTDCAADAGKWVLCKELKTISDHADAHKAGLKGAEWSTTDFFMWAGGRDRLGGFEVVEPEAPKIIAEAWKRYPLEQAVATLTNGFSQFGSVWIGNLMEAQGQGQPYPTIVQIYGQDVGQQHLNSMQQKNQLNFGLINIPAYALLAISVVFLLYAAARARKDERLWTYVTLALLFFLLGNAFVTGVFSGVFARYQARVIWLVPMFAMLLAARWYWAPMIRLFSKQQSAVSR